MCCGGEALCVVGVSRCVLWWEGSSLASVSYEGSMFLEVVLMLYSVMVEISAVYCRVYYCRMEDVVENIGS